MKESLLHKYISMGLGGGGERGKERKRERDREGGRKRARSGTPSRSKAWVAATQLPVPSSTASQDEHLQEVGLEVELGFEPRNSDVGWRSLKVVALSATTTFVPSPFYPRGKRCQDFYDGV